MEADGKVAHEPLSMAEINEAMDKLAQIMTMEQMSGYDNFLYDDENSHYDNYWDHSNIDEENFRGTRHVDFFDEVNSMLIF